VTRTCENKSQSDGVMRPSPCLRRLDPPRVSLPLSSISIPHTYPPSPFPPFLPRAAAQKSLRSTGAQEARPLLNPFGSVMRPTFSLPTSTHTHARTHARIPTLTLPPSAPASASRAVDRLARGTYARPRHHVGPASRPRCCRCCCGWECRRDEGSPSSSIRRGGPRTCRAQGLPAASGASAPPPSPSPFPRPRPRDGLSGRMQRVLTRVHTVL